MLYGWKLMVGASILTYKIIATSIIEPMNIGPGIAPGPIRPEAGKLSLACLSSFGLKFAIIILSNLSK
jgi:hypothetical protein